MNRYQIARARFMSIDVTWSLVQDALRWLLQHPGGDLTIARHRSTHTVTYQTARTDLLDLEARGLLRSEKVSKELVFYAAPNLEEKLREARLAKE